MAGRGFQTIQGGMAPGTERAATSLAAKGLDLLGTTVLAISYQCMDARVSDAKVRALLVRTGEALGVHALGRSSPAFHLWPGSHRCRRRLSIRRDSGGETTGGAIAWRARLEQTVEPAA